MCKLTGTIDLRIGGMYEYDFRRRKRVPNLKSLPSSVIQFAKDFLDTFNLRRADKEVLKRSKRSSSPSPSDKGKLTF